ncbi:MAG: iron ABC transporter permease [Proteobacteria bacterium]|nr:iron ABC transporter permease [Pseudomonadota bacterium]
MERRIFLNLWKLGILLLTAILAIPVFVLVSSIFEPSTDEIWQHLRATVLKDYVVNSIILVIGVGIGTLLLGVATAWLTSLCDFPGRKFFSWALLLPMVIPAYILAYTYTGMFDVAGPVQSWIRESFNLNYGEYWFPEIRSMGGAISMLSLVLFPYVYLLTRAAFLNQSVCTLEVSRTLGCGAWRSFFTVALPLARPAIVAGTSLAMMEALADYGTVKYFGINTFTTGIFRTWFGLDSTVAATQLAVLLLSMVVILVIIEQWSRRQAKFHHTTGRYKRLPRHQLKGFAALLAFLACFLPLFAGFLFPATQLFQWAVKTSEKTLNLQFFKLALNSFMLATIAALVTLAFALFLAYGKRLYPSKLTLFSVRFASLGYAIPGAVIAIGVMIPFAWIDNNIDAWMRTHFDYSTGLLLSGTLFALVFAYVVRFLAISLHAVETGLDKIKPCIDEAGRLLGNTPSKLLQKIHVPIMRGAIVSALLLVFVDTLKELPATLILRPFNFNTLAVRTFELASDERLADSATAALAIMLAGIIPIILLSRLISQSRPGNETT